jgi:hypothetical protein
MDALPYFFLWLESVIRRTLRIGHGKAVAAPMTPGTRPRPHAAGFAKVPALSNRLRRGG